MSAGEHQYIENFLRKLHVTGEYRIDPNASQIPYQDGSLSERLSAALELYQRGKSFSATGIPPPAIVDNAVSLITAALLRGVIISDQRSSSQPTKPERDSRQEIFRELTQEQPQQSSTVYNIHGNVENIVTGTQQNITTVYNNAIEKIDKASNISDEKKSKAKEAISFLREVAPSVLPVAAGAIMKGLGLS